MKLDASQKSEELLNRPLLCPLENILHQHIRSVSSILII